MPQHYTTTELAHILGVSPWRIRRLYETGTLQEPPRIGPTRAIPRESIPAILDALRERGWLPKSEEATA